MGRVTMLRTLDVGKGTKGKTMKASELKWKKWCEPKRGCMYRDHFAELNNLEDCDTILLMMKGETPDVILAQYDAESGSVVVPCNGETIETEEIAFFLPFNLDVDCSR